jgi:hypothetical protein
VFRVSLAGRWVIGMYLIYVDESGNTGAKLDDSQQPVHFLAAVFVSEEAWLDGYEYWRNQVLGLPRALTGPPELHAAEVYHGTGRFREIPRSEREELIRAVLSILRDFQLDVVYSACHKKRLRLQDRQTQEAQVQRYMLVDRFLDPGDKPELPGALAWSLLLSGCDGQLARLSAGEPAHGLVIADRSKLQRFAQRTLRASELILLADHSGPPSWDEVAEDQVFVHLLDTVHFVDSRDSPYIQLADFVAYFIMRAWRAGNWERPGPEPHYDEFVRPAIRGAYHYPARKK